MEQARSERAARTSTSRFGVGKRESHDSTAFYERFEPPEVAADEEVEPLAGLSQGPSACINHDAREMVLPDGAPLPSNSVALVVTSPPYFSGKAYEEALGEGDVPGSYLEYLEMLREVFAECKRVLEPGGRIAVNVANLGRRPYRSLSSDVVRILQDDLHLLLRGEVIWRKGEGASGSCAWGSYRSATNPVLRDVTERVVIASKGRFDRAPGVQARKKLGLPHESDVTADEFMEATLDVWNLAPESARRVQHPAPFPVELPARLIGLLTFRGDLVVDPFMGSGTSLVAAARSGRRYLGYDSDTGYVETARRRLNDELKAPVAVTTKRHTAPAPLARAGAKAIGAIAEEVLSQSGFEITHKDLHLKALGVTVSYVAHDSSATPWYFDVTGSFSVADGGLSRADVLWKALGRAGVMSRGGTTPLVLLTSQAPRRGGEGDCSIRALGPGVVFDVIEVLDDEQLLRLRNYARGASPRVPLPGFWSKDELAESAPADLTRHGRSGEVAPVHEVDVAHRATD